MANKKSQTRKFNGMSYHQGQRANSKKRTKLYKEDRKWLKDNDYKNIGWEQVIKLFQKIEEFIDKYQLEDLTLEELFLEADCIGNKYLSSQEIEEFNQRLSQEVNEVAEEIDKQFPASELEIIDFSEKTNYKYRKKRNQKSYTTVKF
jgi:hypothetical protein